MHGSANWLRWKIKHRDLIVVVAFCAIGLILTFGILAQMPDFSATTGEISLIP